MGDLWDHLKHIRGKLLDKQEERSFVRTTYLTKEAGSLGDKRKLGIMELERNMRTRNNFTELSCLFVCPYLRTEPTASVEPG